MGKLLFVTGSICTPWHVPHGAQFSYCLQIANDFQLRSNEINLHSTKSATTVHRRDFYRFSSHLQVTVLRKTGNIKRKQVVSNT